NGLDALFGVREAEVEFMPDIGDRIALEFDGKPVAGGGFLQAYTATTGKPRGNFEGGRLAVVENSFGKGRTLLVGTHPGVAYFKTGNAGYRRYFADVFAWTGKSRHLQSDNAVVQIRLHEGPNGDYLWIVNPTRSEQVAEIEAGGRALGAVLWGDANAAVNNRV